MLTLQKEVDIPSSNDKQSRWVSSKFLLLLNTYWTEQAKVAMQVLLIGSLQSVFRKGSNLHVHTMAVTVNITSKE